ncbi:MAG TPA: hypothetical protein VI076_00015, partial [Actinopolymorphaceae bacterium]
NMLYHELLKDGKVTKIRESSCGRRYTVVNGFMGRNDRHATSVTCWQVDDPSERGHPRLLTSWADLRQALHQEKEKGQ